METIHIRLYEDDEKDKDIIDYIRNSNTKKAALVREVFRERIYNTDIIQIKNDLALIKEKLGIK